VRLDRIADDIYIFSSSLYAQVTATALVTDAGVILIDTLPFPTETDEMAAYLDDVAGKDAVRYVVLSHHHADHTYGTYAFPDALVIAHQSCRQLLERYGAASLARAKRETQALDRVSLRLPDLTFTSEMQLQLGHRSLKLFAAPGHTADGIAAYVPSEKALIAGDAMMPVPHITGGDIPTLRETLQRFRGFKPSFLVQGHGDVLLRGEVDEALQVNIRYLDAIEERVSQLIADHESPKKLRDIDIESCGLSRIPLDGLVSTLHLNNLIALYKRMVAAS